MKIIECPRDAMQGIKEFIPTEEKIRYINQLLKVGFDTIDFGSFVSPKAIPQLQDTDEVLKGLDLSNTKSSLLAIIANERGASDAVEYSVINYLGYPFSISEEFQKRNTNSTIKESFEKVKRIQELTIKHNKELVIYISMAFGNPYGEYWHPDIVSEWIEKLANLDIKVFSLADTIGISDKQKISDLFQQTTSEFEDIEIGVHLHSNPNSSKEKILLAFNSGCKRFDSAIMGMGGCPMAEDDLVGNIATETLIDAIGEKTDIGINEEEFKKSLILAKDIFN